MIDLVRFTAQHAPPVSQYRDAVREAEDLLVTVRNVDHADSRGAETDDPLHQPFGFTDRQRARRFVEYDNPCSTPHRGSDLCHLPFGNRQSLGELICVERLAHLVDRLPRVVTEAPPLDKPTPSAG